MHSFFADPRYRNERILLVVTVPVSLLLLGGLVTLLYLRETKTVEKPSLLTADQVGKSPLPAEQPEEDKVGLARKALQEARLSDARALLVELLSSPAPALEVHDLMGQLEERDGNPAAAIEHYTTCIEGDPTAPLLYRRGILLRDAGDWAAALEDLDRADRLSPSDIVISNARYLLMIEAGHGEVVRRAIQLKVDLGLQSSWTGWAMAMCALELEGGNIDQAVAILRTINRSTDPATFDVLLDNPLMKKYQNVPAILPFYIRTSVERAR